MANQKDLSRWGDFKSSMPNRTVRVSAIGIVRSNVEYAFVTDLRSRSDFEVPLMSGSRIRPQVGDIWIVTSGEKGGYWQFDTLVRPYQMQPALNLRDTMGLLNELGVLEYSPDQSPASLGIEAPHAAYVGEVRLFTVVLPSGWLACNGSAVSRAKYARLFDTVGTAFGSGDGSTTFAVPTLTAPAASTQYAICAF